jgi:ligand-binding sensor domain-containing protein
MSARARVLSVAFAVAVVIGVGCGQVTQPTVTSTAILTASATPTVTPVPPTPSSTPQPTAAATPTAAPPTLTPTVIPTPFPKSRDDWVSYTNSNQISDLAFDRDGFLWATSGGGVVRWNLADSTHVKYTSEHGLPHHTLTSVAAADDDSLWFGSLGGVVHLDMQAVSAGGTPDEMWTTYGWADGVPSTWISTVAVAPDGAVWAGTLREGAARFDGAAWTTYDTDDGLVSSDVRAIAITPEGDVWFGTCALWGAASHEPPPCFGVSRLTGAGTADEVWASFSEEDGLANNRVNAIAVAPDGAVWFGTGRLDYYPWAPSPGYGGVSRFDGETWTTYTEEDGLAGNWVSDIAIAPDGALWLATAGGLSRFDGTAWQTFVTADGLVSDEVTSVAVAADGLVCAGTDVGISCFNGASWTTYTSGGPASNLVPSIAVAPDGTVWAGSGQPVPAPENTGRGVSRFDGEEWTVLTEADGLADNTVVDIAVEPGGVVWFATGDPDDAPASVSRFDGETWTTYMPDEYVYGKEVRSIAIGPDGIVWLGAPDELTRYDPSLDSGQAEEAWRTYDVPAVHVAVGPEGTVWLASASRVSRFIQGKSYGVSGMETRRINGIAAGPEGTLWVGTTDDGLLYYNGDAWTAYTTDDGLLDNYVADVTVAADGTVWAAVGGGAARFDGTAWVSFDRMDGLASDGVFSVAVGPDGTVWFGTSGGISRYLPSGRSE